MEFHALLTQFGITPNYKGFYFMDSALAHLKTNPEDLLLITKSLYPKVAKKHETSVQAVERNLRTVVTVAWKSNPALLQEMAGYPMSGRPSVSKFLGIVLSSQGMWES